MALKIRMRQQGRNNRPFYRVVVTDVRAPRDGKYLESVGWYNPFESEDEKAFSLDSTRIEHWLKQGAEISERVRALVLKRAPDVIKAYTQRVVEKKAKRCAKRRAQKGETA